MKKIGRYPHNGYPTDMCMGTRRIFIQRVGYGRATTRTLSAPLTSLPGTLARKTFDTRTILHSSEPVLTIDYDTTC